jgi:RNA polymerase sigma factor (sigma-70 family)
VGIDKGPDMINRMTIPGSDDDLLRRFVETGCDEAFAQLVARYAEMVYAAALRQTRRADMAQDVTQATFILLARKAGKLQGGMVLAAWLHKVTRYASLNAIRGENRRRRHEKKAADMAAEQERQRLVAAARLSGRLSLKPADLEDRPAWGDGMDLLDAGIAQLSAKDREAIVLRFLQRHSLAEVGAALGVSEDAAQMRVARAVEKLRGFYRRRGFTMTPAHLSAAFGITMPIAAPAKFASSLSHQALNVARHGSAGGGNASPANMPHADVSHAGGLSSSAAKVSALADAAARSMMIARAKLFGAVGGSVAAAGLLGMLLVNAWQMPAARWAPTPSPTVERFDQAAALASLKPASANRRP